MHSNAGSDLPNGSRGSSSGDILNVEIFKISNLFGNYWIFDEFVKWLYRVFVSLTLVQL